MRTSRCTLALILLAGCGPEKMLDPSTSLPQTFPDSVDDGNDDNDDEGEPSEGSGLPTSGTTGIATATLPTNVTTNSTNDDTNSESGPSGTTSTTRGSDPDTSDSGPPPDTSDSGPPPDSSDDGTFIDRFDAEPGECDVWADNCPNGQKCMPVAIGGNSWNSLKCVPVMGNNGPGDACTYEGDGTEGLDDCEEHAICLGPSMNEGTCVGMCTGTPNNPQCPAGKACAISNGGVLILCVDICDPLGDDCPQGEVCVFLDEQFTCATDASGADGQQNDACEYINVCDPGLACIDSAANPDCNQGFAGCCSAYCDLTLPDPCPGSLACVGWFEQGQAPPGFENLGVCASG